MTEKKRTKEPTKDLNLAQTCLEAAQRLLQQAEALGKDGAQFASSAADLLASAVHCETHIGPRHANELVDKASSIVSSLVLMSTYLRPSATPPEREAQCAESPRELTPWEKRAARIELLRRDITEYPSESTPTRIALQEELDRLTSEVEQEQKALRACYWSAQALTKFADKLLVGIVDRLVDLQDENRGGRTDGEIERIFTEVIPAHHERIERLRKLIPLPPAAFAVAGVDFA